MKTPDDEPQQEAIAIPKQKVSLQSLITSGGVTSPAVDFEHALRLGVLILGYNAPKATLIKMLKAAGVNTDPQQRILIHPARKEDE